MICCDSLGCSYNDKNPGDHADAAENARDGLQHTDRLAGHGGHGCGYEHDEVDVGRLSAKIFVSVVFR